MRAPAASGTPNQIKLRSFALCIQKDRIIFDGRANMIRTVLCSILAMVVLLSIGCKKDQDTLIGEMAELEGEGYKGQELSKLSIEELKKELKLIEDEVGKIVLSGERLGTLYKTVALRYMDREMYGLAADFFRKALDIFPENRLISFKAGLCAAQLAQSHAETSARQTLFEQSEAYYLHAIRIDSTYVDALYALSILYIFELDRSAEALPYLKRIVQSQSRQYRAMFLLARVYVALGRIDEAVSLYQEIIDNSMDDAEVDQAKENRRLIIGT